jgi:hypothetical protein
VGSKWRQFTALDPQAGEQWRYRKHWEKTVLANIDRRLAVAAPPADLQVRIPGRGKELSAAVRTDTKGILKTPGKLVTVN